jgi:adenosylmethionine-8-amino-7-oxononanoate aminotransferase
MLIAPPFVLSESEADLLVERTKGALDETLEEAIRLGWMK